MVHVGYKWKVANLRPYLRFGVGGYRSCWYGEGNGGRDSVVHPCVATWIVSLMLLYDVCSDLLFPDSVLSLPPTTGREGTLRNSARCCAAPQGRTTYRLAKQLIYN